MSNQTIGEKNKELWLELDRRATEIADLERQLADVRRRSADYIDALRSQWETGVRSIEEALSIPDDERGFDFGTINRSIGDLRRQLAEAQAERDSLFDALGEKDGSEESTFARKWIEAKTSLAASQEREKVWSDAVAAGRARRETLEALLKDITFCERGGVNFPKLENSPHWQDRVDAWVARRDAALSGKE